LLHSKVFKNTNNEIKISENLPYLISTNLVEGIMGYMESSVYDLVQIRLYYRPIWL
jgi:16S rRNA A1518/A1519 N6-dimethyltransferase RsmA/KsgA/DIM1 with predicted DNA glycosylase/AP lyase activity